MSLREYRFLLSEVAELDRLITNTPESAVIDRTSLEYRRSQIQEELDAFPKAAQWPVTARLTFNGGQVVNQRGIDADFGAKAVEYFAEAVASAGASQVVSLKDKGRIPNREAYRLRIIGAAIGSFGFELEEIGEPNRFLLGTTPVERGIEQIKSVLKASVGDDEALADALTETQPRALADLRDFLRLMADSRAICSLAFQDDLFRFTDVGQVQQSLAKLSQDNIHEEEREMFGSFLGYLPNGRRAEFKDSQTGEVIEGRVDLSLDDTEGMKNLLNQDVLIRVRTRRVGNGRPRYTIIGYDTHIEM